MGRVPADAAVRYVSPVTARLFSKMGSEILGLSSGEVLAPIEGMSHGAPYWRGSQSAGPATNTLEGSASTGEGETTTMGSRQRHVEIVRSCPISPTSTDVTCPQEYLESILKERGYDHSTRSSASEGCRCEPTPKQISDYQVPLVEAVRRWDMRKLEALAAGGVTMGASNRFGESVVHLATRRGSAPVLQFLLAHGGSLRICDDYGKTPLHDAFWTGEPRFDLVSMMLDLDWRLLRAADVRGATPLRYAKKRHWGLWCAFLDRVKDRHWPHASQSAGEDEAKEQQEEDDEGGGEEKKGTGVEW